ncbi:MAG: 3-deoxy-7-phosphoheptulonate synthase, partial [Gammaproteobacteria bacterium]
MLKDSLNNLHVNAEQILVTPRAFKQALPVSDHHLSVILQSRRI